MVPDFLGGLRAFLGRHVFWTDFMFFEGNRFCLGKVGFWREICWGNLGGVFRVWLEMGFSAHFGIFFFDDVLFGDSGLRLKRFNRLYDFLILQVRGKVTFPGWKEFIEPRFSSTSFSASSCFEIFLKGWGSLSLITSANESFLIFSWWTLLGDLELVDLKDRFGLSPTNNHYKIPLFILKEAFGDIDWIFTTFLKLPCLEVPLE